MGPPDVLFKETEALSCNRYTSQYLSLTSSIMRDQRPEVNKLVHQVDFTCTTMKKWLFVTKFFINCIELCSGRGMADRWRSLPENGGWTYQENVLQSHYNQGLSFRSPVPRCLVLAANTNLRCVQQCRQWDHHHHHHHHHLFLRAHEMSNSLSTLSQKSTTVAEKCDCRNSVTVAVFCDSLTFVRQSHFSATVWTGLKSIRIKAGTTRQKTALTVALKKTP